MSKRPLTAAEKAAYRDLARAAAKLRRAQEAAARKRRRDRDRAHKNEFEKKARGRREATERGKL